MLFIHMSYLRPVESYTNREDLWSDSLANSVLTFYAEGIACKNVDKRKFNNVRRYTKDTLYVLKRSTGKVGEPNSKNQLIFD